MSSGQGAIIPPVAKTPYQSRFITGVPYGKWKATGKTSAVQTWTSEVVAQTKKMKKVHEACAMNVTFLLPEDKYPSNVGYGNDLDNLLKALLDALGETVFSEAPNKDSCVVVMHAMKARVPPRRKAGAAIEILPIDV